MEYNKRQWTRPKLVILTKGTPEENVLTHCKRIGFVGVQTPQTSTQTGCDSGPNNTNCGNCQSRSGS